MPTIRQTIILYCESAGTGSTTADSTSVNDQTINLLKRKQTKLDKTRRAVTPPFEDKSEVYSGSGEDNDLGMGMKTPAANMRFKSKRRVVAKAPEGWSDANVMGLLKNKDVDNPWALAHYLSKQGTTPSKSSDPAVRKRSKSKEDYKSIRKRMKAGGVGSGRKKTDRLAKALKEAVETLLHKHLQDKVPMYGESE